MPLPHVRPHAWQAPHAPLTCIGLHCQQEDCEQYEAALSAVHRKFAAKLLALCQRNGGIYIKGAQLITSIPAVRPEYRK